MNQAWWLKVVRSMGENREASLAVAALVILCLTFFSRLLVGTHVYFLDDLKIIYYPLEHAYAQFQHAGQLPHWSPLFGFGQPLLAWGQLGFFTPPHVLLRALYVPPLTLLQVSVVGYFALGLAGMYVLLRRHALRPIAAAVGAAVWIFSGYNIGHLNHVNFYTATMLLPWLMLAIKQLLEQVTTRRIAGLGIVSGAMILSGHPQATLYAHAMAAVYGLVVLVLPTISRNVSTRATWRRRLPARVGAVAVAGIIAASLAAMYLLPLLEFLPQTERGHDLDRAELFEFSYPPRHAITLIFPRFFGDHTRYWGAKNFQEIAAYVGVLPLLLAGASLVSWRKHRDLKIAGVVLVVTGMAVALGKYSPLYRWLVNERFITSLAIPGRFVSFFDLGIALLAATGLTLIADPARGERKSLLPYLTGAVLVAVTLSGFAYALLYPPPLAIDVVHGQWLRSEVAWAVAGTALWIAAALFRQQRLHAIVVTALAVACLGTLLTLGWDYNPLLPRHFANQPSPFTDNVRDVQLPGNVPARLYSRGMLLHKLQVQEPAPTRPIGPQFSLWQPITPTKPSLGCLQVPMYTDPSLPGEISVSLHTTTLGPALEQRTVISHDIAANPDVEVCFNSLRTAVGSTLYLVFRSDRASGVNLYYAPKPAPESYLYEVRIANASPQQFAASRKPGQIHYTPLFDATIDRESAMLARHVNVVADSSSARWIGAMTSNSFRQFIEYFFANDRSTVDGAGQHVVEKYRRIFNLAGVTHFIQFFPFVEDDTMSAAGFVQEETADIGPMQLRLFSNPDAYPKAFLVRNAIFEPDLNITFARMSAPDFNPHELIFLGSEAPAPSSLSYRPGRVAGTATITRYEATQVDVHVQMDEPAWLVVTDTATEQWTAFIDDQPATAYVANGVFRAVPVPAGEHAVSWRYFSPATARAKRASAAGLTLAAALWIAPWFDRRSRRQSG